MGNTAEVEQLRCYVPPGVGDNHQPVLLVPTHGSKNPLGVVFSYYAPQIRLIYAGPLLPRADMEQMRITVDRFAPFEYLPVESANSPSY